MKKSILISITFLIISSLTFCQTNNYGKPLVSPNSIEQNMMSWLTYERDQMKWSVDYIALDSANNIISKNDFLNQLITEKYLPVKLNSKKALYYQLYRIDENIDKEIGMQIKFKAQMELHYYKMEGKSLPFNEFIDLENVKHDSTSTKGKIVVINCWYIQCKACVAEMPRLNQLVDQMEERKDILFLGMALDSTKELEVFANEHIFKYKIVPNMKTYLLQDAKINGGYPAHIIINREGKIVKVSNNLDESIAILNKEIFK
jgi:peroxiredoxin